MYANATIYAEVSTFAYAKAACAVRYLPDTNYINLKSSAAGYLYFVGTNCVRPRKTL